MNLDKPHSFSKEEALARMQALTTYWATKYGVKTAWQGTTAEVDGNVKGIKFSGNIQVDDDRVRADIKAGFLAEKLGGRQYVEHKVDDYLDAGNALDALQARC